MVSNLIINEFFIPSKKPNKIVDGGRERLIAILKEFSKQKNYHLIIHTTKSKKKYFKDRGVKSSFIITPSKYKYSNFFDLSIKTLLLIKKTFFLKKYNYLKNNSSHSIIYSSSDIFWEVIPAFILKKIYPHTTWVQLIHHIYPNWQKRPGHKINNYLAFYLQKFSLFLIKSSDKIIIINPLLRKSLKQIGIPNKKIFDSFNGIYLKQIEKIKTNSQTPSYDAIFVGRLSPSKGIFDLLNIWQQVIKKNPQAKLAIIGDGQIDIKKEFKKTIKNKNLIHNIDYLGFVPETKKIKLLKSAKVFILPSHEEGWAISVTEALACNLPVVVWDLKNYHPIYNNHINYIPKYNTNLFSQNIIHILQKNTKNKNIPNFIKDLDWQQVFKKDLQIINSK